MKRVINNTIICVIIINILIGCGILKSPADKSELEHDTSYWMNYDATRRGAIISVGKDGNVKNLTM